MPTTCGIVGFNCAKGNARFLQLRRGIEVDLGRVWPICGGTECEQYISAERGLTAADNPPENALSNAASGDGMSAATTF